MKTVHSHNPYVTYLNSLHNLTAGGANALAESQALNRYFGEVYQPFPIIDTLTKLFSEGPERVVVLTGHAGDGKSTLAVDVLKRLRHLPPLEPLAKPLLEKEQIDAPLVYIVKDMSEANAATRARFLNEAFSSPGSWLIVSNTGPLLQSLREYAKSNCLYADVERSLLERLMEPVDQKNLESHKVEGFKKELLVINLTRLDNVEIGSKVLTKLVNHSGWNGCESCIARRNCPILANRNAVLEVSSVVEQRVRWIYKRLTAYEQRLTLRQIVAQLAFALTGGRECSENAAGAPTSADPQECRLNEILFSESFFGFSQGRPRPGLERIHAIALLRRTSFGGPVAANFERMLSSCQGLGWAKLPTALNAVWRDWSSKASSASSLRARFALRRMVYMFGEVIPGQESTATNYLNSILQSPSLTEFDQWQQSSKLTLSKAEKNRLKQACLRVLLEVFSGFSSGQFSKTDTLFLTLLRPDQAIVQPTQLVVDSFQFKEFDLTFDETHSAPALRFHGTEPQLVLTLPLLDYIRSRDAGELGGSLTPIHQAQLDGFRGKLLALKEHGFSSEQTIEILRAGIEGEVSQYRLELDSENCTLELL